MVRNIPSLMRQKRNPKIKKPKDVAISLLKKGNIFYCDHALERMHKRSITVIDIRHILIKGWHMPARDRWTKKDGWSYCFEGLTDDARRLRVVVAIKQNLILITVIGI